MLARVLSGFSCPKNQDVANFFKEERGGIYQKESVSYIPCVFRGKQGNAWIFYPCIKAVVSQGETVSRTTKRKLLRISELDEKSDTYTMSAYLIAQLGKNYTNGANEKITGKELVELAWTVIEDAQYMLGGIVTFLEAENEEKLLSFYRDNRFSQFDTRQTASDTEESHELVQLLRLL